MSKESSSYDSVAWGRKLGAEREPNWLGDLDSHARAWPDRVAQARRHYTEIPFDDLTVVQTGPDKWLLVDADGVEFRPVGFDPLQKPDPEHQRIAAFTVDDGQRLHFLRIRGEDARPTELVEHGPTTWRRVA